MRNSRLFVVTLSIALTIICSINAVAQSKRYRFVEGKWIEQEEEPAPVKPELTIAEVDTTIDVSNNMLPLSVYLPAVFRDYNLTLGHDNLAVDTIGSNQGWISDVVSARRRSDRMLQNFMIGNPDMVKYNIATLPEAPKYFQAKIDPSSAKIIFEEINIAATEAVSEVSAPEVKKRHWLHDFTGLVQFSQAYNSPNWYQGGNNNLNMIINGVWNVKLNPAFHPNLLFENTVAYKLALNSAPDDSLRNYSISEDLLQINSKFGVKARKNWYYSVTMQFKTQLLNNYRTNTRDLTAAFLSPSELNIGLGMTYSSVGKRYNFNASIAPLSYNLKTCTNSRINPAAFGIESGKHTASQMGSNIDCKLVWNMSHNIVFTSRLTAFTDYKYLQSDWENTLAFTINRFLSTQLYAHLRYDSNGATYGDTRWRKWQVKEILSFGFSYKIGTV